MASTADIPDVRRLQNETLPTVEFPAGARQDFRVFFRKAVHEQIWKHASENLSIEICGVLVGLWQRDDAGPFALISEYIRCDSAKSGFAEVTFTHDAWTKINRQMDTQYQDLKIVGWYHSHPNFGIFLSDRDIFIHEHFFSGPGQIAHVVDPVRKIDGVFAWQAGKPVLRPHFWVGERICVTPDTPAENSPIDSERLPSAAGGNVGSFSVSSSLINSLTTVLLFVCVFLIGFMLPARLTDWERRLNRQRDLLGVVAYFAEHKLLRPDLDDDLKIVGTFVQSAKTEVRSLVEQYAKPERPDEEQMKELWNKLGMDLADANEAISHIRLKDELTPDEESVVKEVVRMVREFDQRELKKFDKAAGPAESSEPADQKREKRKSRETDQKKSSSPENSAKESSPRPAENAKSKKDQG